jgi:hypothetical protein
VLKNKPYIQTYGKLLQLVFKTPVFLLKDQKQYSKIYSELIFLLQSLVFEIVQSKMNSPQKKMNSAVKN